MRNQTSASTSAATTPAGTSTPGGAAVGAPAPPIIDQIQVMQTMIANLGREPMPLPGTSGAPRFNVPDITKFIEIYESLARHTRTNPDQEDVVDTLPYYCVEGLQEMVNMMSGYSDRDWPLLKTQLRDRFRHSDTRVFMCRPSSLSSARNKETAEMWA